MPATSMWLPWLVACGAPEPERNGPGDGLLVVDGGAVFDAVDIGTDPPSSRELWIQNGGTGPLSVAAPRIEDGSPFSVTGDPVVLEPAQAYAYALTFDPQVPFVNTGELVVESDDPVAPTTVVPLFGEGIAPVLDIDGDVADFGVLDVGCSIVGTITARNAGNETLVVAPSLAGSTELTLVGGTDLREVEPGEELWIEVRYEPVDTTADSATLALDSSDPNLPHAEVALKAAGALGAVVQVDLFEGRPLAADIVLVVDDSGSMAVEQPALAAGIGAFVDSLVAREIDYRIGVIATDQSEFAGDVVTNATKDAATVLADQISGLGTGGAGTTRALQMLYNCTLPGGDCDLLRREDALYDVIIVSDSPDYSALSPDAYVEYLWTRTTDPGLLRIDVIAGEIPAVSCETCESPGFGYDQAQELTDGTFLSICDDWEENLSLLGTSAVPSTAWRFSLTHHPVMGTIDVLVDGVPADAAQWTYVGWTGVDWVNAIEFDDDAVPSAGAAIEVRYTVQTECG